MECLGCDLANKRKPVYTVFENEHVCCFLDHNPYNEGHLLIVPKKHVRFIDELDERTANAIMQAAMLLSGVIRKLFNPDGITVCQNGGSFDELTHFHMYLVPRYEGQNFADFYIEDDSGHLIDKVGLMHTKRKVVEALNEQ